MNFLTDIQYEARLLKTIGGKAANLYHLKEMGLAVPKWIVIPQEEFCGVLPADLQSNDRTLITELIRTYVFPPAFIEQLTTYFPEQTLFAVRSSAIEEDGVEFSFAGQFESYLFIPKEDLAEKIKAVWRSAFSERVDHYRKTNKLHATFGIAVIVQEMVHADSAGVAFGINPTNGDRKTKVISAVYGLGEGLVSGELDSDNYLITGTDINMQLADKDERFILDPATKMGTRKVAVAASKRKTAVLTEIQINAIAAILDQCRKKYGKPQDIEFAIRNDQIYILQTRPVTNLNRIADRNAAYTLWDNSNIIESYPGVTTPLTFSFISKSYEGAYKLFCEFMGVNKDVIKKNERIFANTLGLINGHVYYNLKTWYHLLAMLPGYSINARFMENMMGVKERFDIADNCKLSKTAAWWNVLKMIFNMYYRFKTLTGRKKQFIKLLNTTISRYKKINYADKSTHELMQLYLDFEMTLLNEWKAPLLNDFFAMIWFGLLQKSCKRYNTGKNPNIHNDLLCGSNDIISIQPIHRSIALSEQILADEKLKQIFLHENEQQIWHLLHNNTDACVKKLKSDIDGYIQDFGERCIGELKLETVSYTQNPTKFIKVLKSYVESGITTNQTSGKTESALRSTAEEEMNTALKYKPLKKWLFRKTLHHARELVSSRENLRYERTRAFGIVREIFSQLGKNFYAEGIVDDPRDLFYLTKEEIFSFIEGTAITQDIKALIELRKQEYTNYKNQQSPSERFASYGTVYHANNFSSTEKIEALTGDLKGTGCCPGRVKAKVKVVLNPDEVSDLNGDILVTFSTDPGWVTLFPSAAAIIVERGSLLSHSAIVSREMGKPCIVGVTGLLKTLNTGDEIEMDGSSGEIKIINKLRS
jgi:phosphoenolpyruvate synthase/pyruvate phosphate dikinase